MEKLIITGVPEHFNFPWRKVIAEQPFLKHGIELVWRDEPMGSGAMNKALKEGKTHMAILLTESFIKDKTEGNPGQIIGMHVRSPLIWGIHTPGTMQKTEIKDFDGAPFLISRMGSGSHLMAFVLAKRQGWDIDRLKFEIIGDLHGALESMKQGYPQLFLWEKFTTKPLVDSGVFNRIGEIPTPWPCFVVVATEDSIKRFNKVIRDLRDFVYQKSAELEKDPTLAQKISSAYGLQQEDVAAWISHTEWATGPQINNQDIENTQNTLMELGLIGKKLEAEFFISPLLTELIDG